MRYLSAIILLLILASATRPELVAGTAEATTRNFHGHNFEAHVVSDDHPYGRISEVWNGSDGFIRVHEGQEYSIVVNNPLPVRVAAAVTVDGLNTIDGKRTRPSQGRKWIIEPYSSITIKGWQTGGSSLRKFYFTRDSDSYARWKQQKDRRNYSKNLGVIGVAYFWDNTQLQRALHPPHPFITEEGAHPYAADEMRERKKSSRSARGSVYGEKAGTGMGRHQRHHVRNVPFNFDSGMYSNSDVLKIHYRFGRPSPAPQPFEDDWEYRYQGNFTPEMP